MSLKECYDKMGADYEDVLSRLRSEVLVRKFALKFLDDDSYANLKAAMESGNAPEAFRGAHGAVALTCGSSFHIPNTKRRASKSPAFVV